MPVDRLFGGGPLCFHVLAFNGFVLCLEMIELCTIKISLYLDPFLLLMQTGRRLVPAGTNFSHFRMCVQKSSVSLKTRLIINMISPGARSSNLIELINVMAPKSYAICPKTPRIAPTARTNQ